MKYKLITLNRIEAVTTDPEGNELAYTWKSANGKWQIMNVAGNKHLTEAERKKNILDSFLKYMESQ